MSGQISKQNVFTALSNAVTTTTASSHTTHPRQHITQNYLLIWVDESIDDSKQDCQNTLAQLSSVVNDVKIFTQPDESIDFLTEVDDIKAFLILEGTLGSQIVPLIHDIPQLDSVYIFYDNKSSHEQWTKGWAKIKGVHTEIKPICEALQLAVKQCNQDSIAVSFVTVDEGAANTNSNQLEPCFMYTQIFKEILLEIEHDEQSIKNLAAYWRQLYHGNMAQLNNIRLFEQDYQPESAIWWYTRESFTYEMLNRALRNLESDTMIDMGFFIRDLHQQIKQLHQTQVKNYRGKSFIVYRGQGLLKTDFAKLLKTKNGLMSFNNFLSTSTDRDVSRHFAEGALGNIEMVGILFKMTVDPSVTSAPFASIREVSYFQTEEEILFSMHTVFRIGKINRIDNNSPLYQVDLKLTADDDKELRILTDRIREEVDDATGWQRLGRLLIRLGQFDKAEKLYIVLLEQTSDEGEKALYYNQLGYVKHDQVNYKKAIEYYEKALEIRQKMFHPNHPDSGISYNNIGGVYEDMGEHSKALSFYEKALEIFQKNYPVNNYWLAVSYDSIGTVYNRTKEYSKAFSSYEKALDIRQKTLPPNHPLLAISYNNIGSLYDLMEEYWKALSFNEKALEIRQKTLPPNHLHLTDSYNHIGQLYKKLGKYSKALSFYEKAVEIRQKTLPPNHPDLASSYNNIGEVYLQLGEYSKALPFYEKAVEIKKTLPANYPDLAIPYNNIANVYNQMGEYSKALSYYEKDLEISEQSLPPNHPDLATSYTNIGLVYKRLGEYSKALSFYEKAVEITKTLSSNDPDLGISYNNIGEVYREMGECVKALSYYEKALEIFKKTLPNHHGLAASYNNIALVYESVEDYSKALSYFKCALNILENLLLSNHPDGQSIRQSIERVKRKL